jgi:hypothetical protein
MGCSRYAFYRAIGRRKLGGQWEGDSEGGTSMAPIIEDGNREREAMGCSHFRRGRRGGGEATPWCRWQTTKQRVAQRLTSGG